MLVQSGKPVGVDEDPRVGAARADRQLQPGRRLGQLGGVPPARGPGPDHVRPDDRRLVDLHRHPGHPPGHLRDVRRSGGQEVRRDPGRHHHAHRRSRRHGRRAAARRDHERRRRDLHRVRPDPDPAADRPPLPRRRRPTTSRRPYAWRSRRATSGGRSRSGCSATPPRCFPQAARDGRTDRHRHRPDLGARPVVLPARRRRRSRTGRRAPEDPGGFTKRRPGVDGRARAGDGRVPGQGRRGLRLRQLDPRRGPQGRLRPGLRVPGLRAGVHPAAVLRGQGPVPLGRALRRPGRHRRHRQGDPRAVPGQRAAAGSGSPWPASGWPSRGSPRASAGWGTASATWPA